MAFGVSGLILTFMMILPVMVGAQPGSTPPTGVVNAIFNSITTTTTGIFGGNLETAGNLYIQNSIENNKTGANPVAISDPDGVKVSAGPLDVNVNIINTGGDVTIQDKLKVNGDALITNVAKGSSASLADDSQGLYAVAPLTAGPLGQYGVYAIGLNGVGGFFTSSGQAALQAFAPAGNIALVAQSIGGIAVNAVGTIKNENLTIAANGDISDSNGETIINDALTVTGHTKFNGTIGTTYALSKTSPVDAGVYKSIAVACNPGDELILCGAGEATRTATFELNYVGPYPNWSNTCHAVGTNKSSSEKTFKVDAKCWNLDG